VYATTVRSKKGAVTVQEFGSFARQEGQRVFANFTGQTFPGQDFAERYSCPGGDPIPGKAATEVIHPKFEDRSKNAL
jgi:hypothetical protein